MGYQISIAIICVTPALWHLADRLRIAAHSRMKLLPDFAAPETAREIVEIVKYCCAQEFDRISVLVDKDWAQATGRDYERLSALMSSRRLSGRLSVIVVDSPDEVTLEKITCSTTK